MPPKKPKAKMGATVSSSTTLASKYPGSGLASTICLLPDDTLWLPSRCLPLNYALGGGIPYGHKAEFFGEESSGKTLAALDFGYTCQALGGEIILNDAEQAFTIQWAEQNGLNPAKIHLWNSTSIEYISDWLADTMISVRSRLKNNEPILFILDSLAAVDCEANVNAGMIDAKAEMGNRAKAIYKMLRIRSQMMADLGVTGIFINQLRKKVGAGMFEDPDTTPGGGAMKFFAAQRVGFYAGKQITSGTKANKKRLGVETSIRLKKNKVAPPRPTFKADIYFNPEAGKPLGFDRYLGLLDILVSTEVVERRGSNVYFKDNMIARSEDRFNELIEEDAELRGKLIKRSGINTISRTRRKIEAAEGNLFPVKITAVKSQVNSEPEDDDEDE